ncbi:MAG: anhydro-N-acetylmuramic acid kinase [Bacteroidota bacterium]
MSSAIGVGVMSGTSLDGVDLVAAEFSWTEKEIYQYSILSSRSIPYSDQWVSRLANLIDQSGEIFAKTHVYYGHFLGATIRNFIKEENISPDFVGSHGHTIFHQPEKNFTAQIGDGETVVSYLTCPYVTNFRNKDVALGGQGAPLVPLGEKYLFPGRHLFLNLGGFCNLAVEGLAYDVSSCNGVLNYLVQQIYPELPFDDKGNLAASGNFSEALFTELEALPFYQAAAPKSLGWEWVIEEVLPIVNRSELPIQDKLHTFCHHVANQIFQSLRALNRQNESILISGGGTHNEFLISLIAERLSTLDIHIEKPVDDSFIDFKEALIFSFLALRTLTGKPTILPSATGASEAGITGSIHLPQERQFNWFDFNKPVAK